MLLKISKINHKSQMDLKVLKSLHSYMNKQINGYDVSDVLLDPTLMENAIKKTVYQNLDILPASSKLIETDMKLKTNCMKSDTRLDIALQKWQINMMFASLIIVHL